MSRSTAERLDALEQSLTENAQKVQENALQNEENAKAISNLGDLQGAFASSTANGVGKLAAADIYEQACRQVVAITTTVTTTTFFGMTSSGDVSGSGFIISEDGYIITNYHVVEYADGTNNVAKVILHDGTEYEAQLVGKEEINDIAVLKIEATGLDPVRFGDSDALKVGDTVYAVGNPMGELEFSMSTGHVSALDRVVSTEEAQDIKMFQLDAAVH